MRMKNWFLRPIRSIVVVLMSLFAFESTVFALNCQDVRHLVTLYLRFHYFHHKFDDQLSERTLENFIKSWDPGKLFFLQADIESFRSKFAKTIDDKTLKADCSAMETIVDLYSKRFSERHAEIGKLIKLKHDFTIDEYMNIDRKKLKYAKTTEELTERWRKRIKFQFLQLKTSITVDEARAKLKKRYELQLKRHNDMDADDLYSSFLESFATALDPHSSYMPPAQLEDFRINTRLSLEGIGAVLRSEEGFTTIMSLVPGGAAFKTGKVKVDDKIVAVGQNDEAPVDVIDMELREVVKLIRGKRGTTVKLTIVRESKGKTSKIVVPIVREKIQLEDRAAKSYVYETSTVPKKGKNSTYKIGVIDLPSFYIDFEGRSAKKADFRSSSADMKKRIAELKKQKIDALVVDLRSNGGGSLDESIHVAGLFFDEGPVVQIKGGDEKPMVSKDSDGKTWYEGPLVVMIDSQSASASEIFAGAIKDYGRGLIVGDSHTFGKGTVQNLNDLSSELGAVKVTISKFYRPSGASTQLRGVASDIVLPSLVEEYEIGEKHYEYALPWEKIPGTKHVKFDQVKPYLSKLKLASASRVKTNDDYVDLMKDIQTFRKNKEERSKVSLKEKKEEDEKPKGETTAKKDEKVDTVEKVEEKMAEKENTPEPDMNEVDPEMLKDPVYRLKRDIQLQESLLIATDYTRLMNKKPLVDSVLLDLQKEVEKQNKKEVASEKKLKK